MNKLMTKLKGVALTVLTIATGMASFSVAADAIEYLKPVYNDDSSPTCVERWETAEIDEYDVNVVFEWDFELSDGTYVIAEDMSLPYLSSIAGDVKLILMDGVTARLSNGLTIGKSNPMEGSTPATLTIYGQSEGTGKLVVENGSGSAIACVAGSKLIFNGGCVMVKGTEGGIDASADNVVFRINGGQVLAHSTTSDYAGIRGSAYIDDNASVKYVELTEMGESKSEELLPMSSWDYGFTTATTFGDEFHACPWVYVNDPSIIVRVKWNQDYHYKSRSTFYKKQNLPGGDEQETYAEDSRASKYVDEKSVDEDVYTVMSVLYGQTVYAQFYVDDFSQYDGWHFPDGSTEFYQSYTAPDAFTSDAQLITLAAENYPVRDPATVIPSTAEHTSVAVYTNDTEVAGVNGEYTVARDAAVTVVWTITEEGYMFADGEKTFEIPLDATEETVYVDAPEVLVQPASVSFTPTTVDHATASVYANGEALTASSGAYTIPFNATGIVVYVAAPNYFFAGGVQVVTNKLVTSTDPATMIGSLPTASPATQVGDAVYAYLTGGICTIYGTGTTWNTTPLDAQWENVKEVRISEGVTEVGNYFFYKFFNLTNVTVASTVTKLNQGAFSHCLSLEQITFEGSSLPTTVDGAIVIHACIKMNGSVPVVYPIPNVMVNAKSLTLKGKDKLTDPNWVDVTAGEESKYHFFKYEMK